MRARAGRLAGTANGDSSGGPGSSAQPAKDKPGIELVGKRVKVWWPDDEQFYLGTVKHFNAKRGKHTVIYDDGDQEHLDLHKEIWEQTDIPPEAPDSADTPVHDPEASNTALSDHDVDPTKGRSKARGGKAASSLSKASSADRGGGTKARGRGGGVGGVMKRARSADSAASAGLMSGSVGGAVGTDGEGGGGEQAGAATRPALVKKVKMDIKRSHSRLETSSSAPTPTSAGEVRKTPKQGEQIGPGGERVADGSGGGARDVAGGEEGVTEEGAAAVQRSEGRAGHQGGAQRGPMVKSHRTRTASPRPPKPQSIPKGSNKPSHPGPSPAAHKPPPPECHPLHNPTSIFPPEAMAAIMSPADPTQDGHFLPDDRIGSDLLSMGDPLPDPLSQFLSPAPISHPAPAGKGAVTEVAGTRTSVTSPRGRVRGDASRTPSACGPGLSVHPVVGEDAGHEDELVVEVFCNGVRGLYMAAENMVECRCSGCRPEPPQRKRFTPRLFEQHAGMATCKKWRFSIKLLNPDGTGGAPLGKWLEDTGIEIKQPGKRTVAASPRVATKTRGSVLLTPGRSSAPNSRPPRSPHPGHQNGFRDPPDPLPDVGYTGAKPAVVSNGRSMAPTGFTLPTPLRASSHPHDSTAPPGCGAGPGADAGLADGQPAEPLNGFDLLDRDIVAIRPDCGIPCVKGDGFQVRRLRDPPVFEVWATSLIGFEFSEVTIKCEASGRLCISAEPSEPKWAELWALKPVKMVILLPERVRPETAQSVITATGHFYMRVQTSG